MAPKQNFPHPTATLPFWRTGQLHELDSHRSTKELPQETDVLIIGAGFAGASTAYHLLDGNPSPPSIVILEARQACSGATGRNGGHLKPDVYFNTLKYSKKYGDRDAAEFAKFEAANIPAVKELVEKENIDCDFHMTRAMDVYLDKEQARETIANYHKLVEIGAASLGDVHLINGKTTERVTGVKDPYCAFSFTAGHVWPYKLVMHLLSIAVKKGVNLQTTTPVTSVSESPDAEGRWTVQTERGSIKAKKIVYATNAYTAGVAPQFQEKIVPVRGICSRIVTPKGDKSPLLLNTYSLRFGHSMYDYLIPRPDGSIVVGGARQDFWHDQREWYDVTDDSALIEPAKHYFDGLMQRHFVGWEESGAYTENVWTGIMGYSSDYMPYVGELPNKPGQIVIAGFTGHGMPLILLSAKGIAKILREGVEFKDAGIPRLFEPTPERMKSTKNEILDDLAVVEQPEVRAKL